MFTLNIDHPDDAVSLVTFLVTALVITRLASRAREEARKAEARRNDLARLYELASRLVSVSPDIAVGRRYLALFRQVFSLTAVCLFDGIAAASSFEGESRVHLESLTRQVYISGRDYSDEESRIVVVRSGSGEPVTNVEAPVAGRRHLGFRPRWWRP